MRTNTKHMEKRGEYPGGEYTIATMIYITCNTIRFETKSFYLATEDYKISQRVAMRRKATSYYIQVPWYKNQGEKIKGFVESNFMEVTDLQSKNYQEIF